MGLERARLLVAQFRFPLQGAQHNFVEPDVHVDPFRRWLQRLAGQFAGEHLVEDHPERVNVRAMVHRARVVNLFRGQTYSIRKK